MVFVLCFFLFCYGFLSPKTCQILLVRSFFKLIWYLYNAIVNQHVHLQHANFYKLLIRIYKLTYNTLCFLQGPSVERILLLGPLALELFVTPLYTCISGTSLVCVVFSLSLSVYLSIYLSLALQLSLDDHKNLKCRSKSLNMRDRVRA